MQPTIKTERLELRAFTLADAQRVQVLCGHAHFAEMTENIPHPYEDGMAEQWIRSLKPAWENRETAAFAMYPNGQADLIGCCGLRISTKHNRASLGYWVGMDYWGNGYCTEAASALVAFGFKELNLHRIEAQHLSKNPASGAVMRKIGMSHEATLVDYVQKGEKFENIELYSIFA